MSGSIPPRIKIHGILETVMHERFKKKKNFLLTTILAILLWLAWAIIFLFVPPEISLVPILLLGITFLATLFTTSLVLANTRRGLLISVGVAIFMIMNYYGIGNYLNILLIAGILITVEYYLSSR